MEGKYIAGIAAIVVAVILVGSVLAPVIDTVSGGAWDETITTTYNEDPDLTFDRLTSDFALDITVTFGDDISIVNGEDTVTATSGPMFLLAADNSAVFINTADEIILVWTDTDGTQSVILQGDFTAVIADDKLTIDDGTSYDLPLPTSYLYVPSSTGQYGSFPDGELTKRAEDPVIAAGSFAGVVGYNTSVTLVGDAMQMEVVGNDTTITEVNWIAAVEELDPQMIDFDPGQITIQPLDPSIIDPIDIGGGDAIIMLVPTPSYTDGDWGYNLITSGYDTTVAKIVSYSGAGGGAITIPATVGGYDVKEVGTGGNQETVFNTSLVATDLTIPNGIVKINNYAFNGCSGFTGSLVIPDSVTSIGVNAFNGCSGFTGSLVIPDSVTTISNNAFSGCSGFTGSLAIPDGVTTISDYAFNNCSGFTGSLAIPDGVTTISNNVFRGCSGFTGSLAIPDSVTSIGSYAFNGCSGFTGSLVIPDSVTSIGVNAFSGCSGFTGSLAIPDSVTTISNNAFNGCSGFTSLIISMDGTINSNSFGNTTNLKEVLNLGSLELTTTSYGLNADTIQDHIDAEAYIAPATVTEVIHHSGGGGGGMGAMYAAIPVVILAAILLAAVSMFVIRRGM